MQEILNNTGNPPSSSVIYEHLFNFIDDVLFDFKPLSRTGKGDIVTSEDDITQDLVGYLEDKQEFSKSTYIYSFKFENQSKKGNRRTDIGVRLGRKYTASNRPLFCWIEAKCLPTPQKNTNKPDRDEREYVIVDKEKFKGNGGIQRFKEGDHASDISYSMMIGYVQENNADYWLEKINGWIAELINMNREFWKEGDYLSKYDSGRCDRYLSVHGKKDNTTITLHHYWIDI